MPLPISTPSQHCGRCHLPASADCPDTTPLLPCGEGGAGPHNVQATLAVVYVVDLSGRRDYTDGDVRTERLYCCDHPACIGSAEGHAHDVGLWIDTEPLTLSDIEDATGMQLSLVGA